MIGSTIYSGIKHPKFKVMKTNLIKRLSHLMNEHVKSIEFLESLTIPQLCTLIEVYERQNNLVETI